jgi:hypothetical protein
MDQPPGRLARDAPRPSLRDGRLQTGDLLARAGRAHPGTSRAARAHFESYLDTAAYLFDRLEHAGLEDHVVDNDDRPIAQVADDVLHAVGWLGTRSPDPRLTATVTATAAATGYR